MRTRDTQHDHFRRFSYKLPLYTAEQEAWWQRIIDIDKDTFTDYCVAASYAPNYPGVMTYRAAEFLAQFGVTELKRDDPDQLAFGHWPPFEVEIIVEDGEEFDASVLVYNHDFSDPYVAAELARKFIETHMPTRHLYFGYAEELDLGGLMHYTGGGFIVTATHIEHTDAYVLSKQWAERQRTPAETCTHRGEALRQETDEQASAPARSRPY